MVARVLIRADGGLKMGLGHLVRCHALALALRDDFKITFFCKEIPEKIREELMDSQITVEKISNESDFLGIVKGSSIVVLDGYHFTTSYQKEIKGKGAKLICIDDLFDIEFFADLIINHAPDVWPENYQAQSYTQFALGPRFALLRPAFLAQALEARIQKKVKSVIICFGGADSKNLTLRTAKVVTYFLEFESIIVVTGAAYEFIETLTELGAKDTRIKLYNAVRENEMALLMRKSDLAIVPASGILLEALACHCVVISGKYADNQELLFERYKTAGMFITAGHFEAAEIDGAVRNAIASTPKPQSPFDGKSAARLRDIISRV